MEEEPLKLPIQEKGIEYVMCNNVHQFFFIPALSECVQCEPRFYNDFTIYKNVMHTENTLSEMFLSFLSFWFL